jgi:hypothetical protein
MDVDLKVLLTLNLNLSSTFEMISHSLKILFSRQRDYYSGFKDRKISQHNNTMIFGDVYRQREHCPLLNAVAPKTKNMIELLLADGAQERLDPESGNQRRFNTSVVSPMISKESFFNRHAIH